MDRRPELQIALLGDSGTGKTVFFEAATDENAHAPRSFIRALNTETTIGADFRNFRRDVGSGRVVKTRLFDTAGQERFAIIVQSYYRNNQVFILMYDVTSRASFESITERWLPSVLAGQTRKIGLVLVGAKIDLLEENGGRYTRAVSVQEGKEKAEQIGAIWMEVCAVRDGGHHAYRALVDIIRHYEHLQPAEPKRDHFTPLAPPPSQRRLRCALL
jgi:small GTP-binding protein